MVIIIGKGHGELSSNPGQGSFFHSTIRIIGLMSRVSANDPGDWGSIPGRVIPKTQKNGTWCCLG